MQHYLNCITVRKRLTSVNFDGLSNVNMMLFVSEIGHVNANCTTVDRGTNQSCPFMNTIMNVHFQRRYDLDLLKGYQIRGEGSDSCSFSLI
jgi:hypothetical protein